MQLPCLTAACQTNCSMLYTLQTVTPNSAQRCPMARTSSKYHANSWAITLSVAVRAAKIVRWKKVQTHHGCRQYCSSYACSTTAYLVTVTRAGAIGHVNTGASAAAVHWAVKLIDGDGKCAVRVVIARHTNIPNTCNQNVLHIAGAFDGRFMLPQCIWTQCQVSCSCGVSSTRMYWGHAPMLLQSLSA